MTITWKPDIQKTDTPLFMAITRALSEDISAGRLAPDTRLPTHRELADQLNVAIGTITRAYNEAEKKGLIRSEGRRGTFVGETQTERSLLSKLIEAEDQAINLSHNHPYYGADPDLSQALKRISRRADLQKLMQYPPSAGFPKHRAAAAKWIAGLGMKIDPESVIITAGAQHGILVVLAAIGERDDVIITDSYTYPGLKAIAELFGLQLVGIPMDSGGMRPDAIESLCRLRGVKAIYCNPTLHNPTNIIYSEQRRKDIAALAEKYDFSIIEDEILRPLIVKPPPFISSFAPERSYLVVSASKTIAAGIRFGFISTPAKLKQRVLDSLQTSMLCVSPISAEIFTNWLDDGSVEKIISRRRMESNNRQELARSILKQSRISTHPNSCHIWLHLPDNWTSMEFTIEAYRRGVAVTPAEIFAVDKNSSINAVRLSIATVANREILKTGLEIIAGIQEGTPLQDSATV